MAASSVHCGLSRNGVTLEDGASLGSGRVADETDYSNFAIDYIDKNVTESGTYEYEVLFKQTKESGSPYGYLGRRGYDTSPGVATTITLSVLDPLP
jgi:hypothetical protein